MNLSTEQLINLIILLSAGVFVFTALYLLPSRYILPILILIIPFQPIDTRLGSINMALTYIVGFTMVLKGEIKRLPILWAILVLAFAYLISFSLVNKSTYFSHVIYMVNIGSNFLLFYIIYNYVINEFDINRIVNLLVVLNILILGYAFIQFLIGYENYSLFGLKNLTIAGNKHFVYAEEYRLRGGPFNAVGINAEYMVLQILFLGYLFISSGEKKKKIIYALLMALDFFILVGTGNRGGFISLVFGGMLFSFAFRKEIGIYKIIGTNLVILALFYIVGFIMISYTEYNYLFKRLSETEINEGIPDTRARVWPMVYAEIKKRPVYGYGPYLKGYGDIEKVNDNTMHFPHNLYLYILYTIGSIGLIAYGVLCKVLYNNFKKAKNNSCDNRLLKGIPKLGMLLLVVFLFDQLKVEFLRSNLNDYQHYIFMLFGTFLAISHVINGKKVVNNEGINSIKLS